MFNRVLPALAIGVAVLSSAVGLLLWFLILVPVWHYWLG